MRALCFHGCTLEDDPEKEQEWNDADNTTERGSGI